MKIITALLILIVSISCSSAKPRETVPYGVWSWGKIYKDKDVMKKNFDFCAKQNITHIDQWVSFDRKSQEIAFKKELKGFIKEAHKRGMTINLLTGSSNMFFEGNHAMTLSRLQKVIDFAKQVDCPALRGMKYDVEIYGNKKFREGDKTFKKKVKNDYLGFLVKAQTLLKSNDSSLELAVDVPAAWDNPIQKFVYKGISKPLVHHIQDHTDYIGIMSYRKNANGILKLCEGEMKYAELNQLVVCPSLETLKINGKERHITFWHIPVSDYKKSLVHLQRELKDKKHVRFIMIHHLGSLRKYLEKNHIKE